MYIHTITESGLNSREDEQKLIRLCIMRGQTKASSAVKLICKLSTIQNSIPPYVYNIECAVNVSRWIAFYQKKVGFQTGCNFASVRKAKASGADRSC